MRIVTILILIALAAAAYIVRFAGQDRASVERPSPAALSQAAGEADPRLGSEPESLSSKRLESGARQELANEDLPTEFPSELKRRSRGVASSGTTADEAAAPKGPGSGSASDIEPAAPSVQRRETPDLREPEESVDPAIETLIAERLAVEPASGRRSVREVSMPSPPSDAESAPTEITLPSKNDALDEATESIEPEKGVEPPAVAAMDISSVKDPLVEVMADLEPITEQPAVDVLKDVPATEVAALEGDSGPMPSTTKGVRGSVVDSSGKAVPKVKVDVIDQATGETVRTVDAGVDGIFVAQDLRAGRYALAVRSASVPLGISAPMGTEICRSGNEPAGYGSECVEVANLGEAATATIVLPLSSGVQGTVLGKSGQPEPDVLVRAISKVPGFADQRVIAKSDAEGFFFLGLVPGPYELQFLLPGNGEPEDLARTVEVFAKPGSALLLKTVDFSKKALDQKSSSVVPAAAPRKPEVAPLKTAEEQKVAALSDPIVLPSLPQGRIGDEPRVLVEGEAKSSVSIAPAVRRQEIQLGGGPATDGPSLVPPADVVGEGDGDGDEGEAGTVELRGRIISKWGESLPAMSVMAETSDGKVVEMTQTNDSGNYVLESVPVGSVIVRVARDLEINREGPRGTTLLKRPEPVEVLTFSGQKRVTLEDVVVDVRRVYRLSGKITIGAEAFEEFKKTIRPVKRGQDFLTEEQFRRAYYRGLRLVQNNRGVGEGGKRPTTVRGQSIPIAPDGTFVWTCTLPADDIVLVLESRSGREGGGYRGPIGIPITPAGVKPATIEIMYPAVPKEEKPGDGGKRVDVEAEAEVLADSPLGSPLGSSGGAVEVTSPAELSVPAAGDPIAPIR